MKGRGKYKIALVNISVFFALVFGGIFMLRIIWKKRLRVYLNYFWEIRFGLRKFQFKRIKLI